jgi:hypothetical protein
MKKITIEIETVNAAFEDYNDGFTETAHILESIADKIIIGDILSYHILFDSNGNNCGRITIEQGDSYETSV